MRIFGFILLATLGVSNLVRTRFFFRDDPLMSKLTVFQLLKRRLPPRKVAGGLLNLVAFKSAPYSVYCASAFVTFLGIYTGELNSNWLSSWHFVTMTMYTVLTYVGVSATDIGISSNFAFYFIAIANASSLFGRYVAGTLCDRSGMLFTVLLFWTDTNYAYRGHERDDSVHRISRDRDLRLAIRSDKIISHCNHCNLWVCSTSQHVVWSTFLISTCSFSSGSYVSLLSNPIMEMGETGDVGRRIGMFMSILAIGALAGPPISGAIGTATGDFKAVGYYAGSFHTLRSLWWTSLTYFFFLW